MNAPEARQQLAIHVQASQDVLNFFSYFTNLSNLYAAAVLLLGAFDAYTERRRSRDLARAASVVNMTVVGLVFAVLLRNVDLGSLLPWVNFVLHYFMPCAVVVDWLADPPRSKLGARQLLLVMVFPALYFAYVIGRGGSVGWYPYPFLDPAHVCAYGAVAVYGLGIAATFLAAGWLLLFLGERRRLALLGSPARD